MKRQNIFITFFILVFSLSVFGSVYAEYKGPNGGARRYNYPCGEECSPCCGGVDSGDGAEHCNGERSICCNGTYPVSCCTTKYCTANYPDATINLGPVCSIGFGVESWCRGEVTVNAVGVDNHYKITGIENSDGTWLTGAAAGSMTKSFVYSDEQSRNVSFWAHSGLGDTSAKATTPVKIDHTIPVAEIEITGVSKKDWYRDEVVVTSVGTDAYGEISKQYVDIENGSVENKATIPSTFSGTIVPKTRTVDKAGNDTGWQTWPVINVDNEKPVTTNGTDPQGKWFSSVVPLSVTGTDAHSGVAYGEIIVDDEVVYSPSGATGSTSYMPDEGKHTVKYAVVDNVGFRSDEIGPFEFGYDITEPALTLDSNQSFDIVGPAVTISGSVADALSGVGRVEIKYGYTGNWVPVTGQPVQGETTGTWSHTMSSDVAEGKGNFYVRAFDVAGNLNQNKVTFSLNSDYTAPTIGIKVEGQKGAGGVYSGVVTFTADCTDAMAGVREQYVNLNQGAGEKLNSTASEASFTGVITPSVRAVDNVGNDSGAIDTDPITIDNEKPYWVDYALPEEGKVYKDGFTLSVKGADDLGGMYSATIIVDGEEFPTLGDSAEYQLPDGTHTFAYIITDNAGNLRDSRTDPEFAGKNMTISVDTTAPEIEITEPEAGIFVKGTFDVKGRATDNMGVNEIQANPNNSGYETAASGGLGTTELPFTYTVDTTAMADGTAEVFVKAIDAAGNESEPKSITVTVDNTAPTCHIEVEGIRGAGGSFRGSVTMKSVCEDSGSGVKTTWINAGDGDVEGQVTLPETYSGNQKPVISGEDNVGNNTGPINDAPMYYNGELIDNFVIDNNPPVVTDFFMPSNKWMRLTENMNLYVDGKDDEGPIMTGTFIINGIDFTEDAENDHTDIGFLFPEGISSLMYYVTDAAGNDSEKVGLIPGTSRQ